MKIQEPEFVFLTAFSSKTFKQHIQVLGVTKVYEKPLQIETLKEILGGLSSDDEEDSEAVSD